jgi:GGDEF domain-containing protein
VTVRLAETIGVAHDRVEVMTSPDALTGLANHAALQQLGRQLTAAVGERGQAAPFGGEVFACIHRVPGDRTEAVRAAIARAYPGRGLADEIQRSASVGFGEVDGPGDVDAALSRADVARYLARSARRERMAA